ncbi:MAG: hypothetical protein H6633_30035 [Anaerolineales bacterium]|nr:hypothetical protein [Anaerolineales bacterium]
MSDDELKALWLYSTVWLSVEAGQLIDRYRAKLTNDLAAADTPFSRIDRPRQKMTVYFLAGTTRPVKGEFYFWRQRPVSRARHRCFPDSSSKWAVPRICPIQRSWSIVSRPQTTDRRQMGAFSDAAVNGQFCTVRAS